MKISTMIVLREATFTETVQSSLNYERVRKKGRVLCIVDVRIIEIVDDMMCSKFLAATSRAPYVGYIMIGKRIMRHNDVPRSLIHLCKDAPVLMTPGLTHTDDPSIHTSYEVNILLNIKAADALVKNSHNHAPAPFYQNTSYRNARALLDGLHVHLAKLGEE